MDAVLTKALSEGLGYGLFCVLLYYILKQQEKRDAKQDSRDEKSGERESTYQRVILELTKNFEAINNISCTVETIKIKVEELLKNDER
jgi:hypothetical protein